MTNRTGKLKLSKMIKLDIKYSIGFKNLII